MGLQGNNKISINKPDYMKDQPIDSQFGFLYQIINDREIISFIYRNVILLTGFLMISLIASDGFPFERTISFMVIWLILILLLQPPNKALMRSDPLDFEIDSYMRKE